MGAAAEVIDNERGTTVLVYSLVVSGDISRLNPEQRAWYYRRRCEELGLDPLSKPFDILKLNGKEILYLNKIGTDQLARIHRINRTVIRGPEVIKVHDVPMLYCLVEAKLPDGRTEQEAATVPLTDPLNAVMKCITKAKRRATIAITGAGALDESEFDTIPPHLLASAAPIDPTLGAATEVRVLPPANGQAVVVVDGHVGVGASVETAQARAMRAAASEAMPDVAAPPVDWSAKIAGTKKTADLLELAKELAAAELNGTRDAVLAQWAARWEKGVAARKDLASLEASCRQFETEVPRALQDAIGARVLKVYDEAFRALGSERPVAAGGGREPGQEG